MELDAAISDALGRPYWRNFCHAHSRTDVLTLLRLICPSAADVRDARLIGAVRRAGYEVLEDDDGMFRAEVSKGSRNVVGRI